MYTLKNEGCQRGVVMPYKNHFSLPKEHSVISDPFFFYSFLCHFGAFLRSEITFSKLIVEPPHHLVTCAEWSSFL